MSRIILADLPLFREAYIDSFQENNSLHRRLMDLGFTTGNQISPLFHSPLGDPTAYSIMGSIIALRRSDAAQIWVTPVPNHGGLV